MKLHDARIRGTIEELRPRLEQALLAVPGEARDEAIALLTPWLDEAEATDPVTAGRRGVETALDEPDTMYAFQLDDLKLLKEAAVIAAALFAGLSNPVAIVGGLIVFLFRFRRRRCRLTGNEGLVLLTLRDAPPEGWAPVELARRLPLVERKTASEVTEILGDLADKRRVDGTPVALVTEKNGRWRDVDVFWR